MKCRKTMCVSDDLDKLEQELRALEPRRVSADLADQIRSRIDPVPEAALSVLSSRRQAWRWASAAVTAAAACLTIAFVWRGLRLPTQGHEEAVPGAAAPLVVQQTAVPLPRHHSPTNDAYVPVAPARYVLAEKDEGLVVVDGRQPMRRIRCRYVDHEQWDNGSRNMHVGVARPRENVVLVSMETD